MRRRLRKLLVVPMVVAAWVAVAALPAPAETPEATGWWWKGNVTPLVPIPKPPTVPAGGLYVAADPTGRAGVSGLRLTISTDSSIGPVTLRVASTQGTPAIQACPSLITWTPEEGGPLSSAPPDDCAGASVNGAYDAPSATVSFEVSPFVVEGVLNIVLVPQAGAVFQTAFEKPGDDTVMVQAPPPETDGGGTTYETFEPTDLPGFEGTVILPEDSFIGGTPPQTFAPTTTSPPTTAARTGPARTAPTRPTQLASSDEREAAQAVAAIVFVALAAMYLWVLRTPGRPPRLIGPMAAMAAGGRTIQHAAAPPQARGVGRFRRTRAGAAPRL